MGPSKGVVGANRRGAVTSGLVRIALGSGVRSWLTPELGNTDSPGLPWVPCRPDQGRYLIWHSLGWCGFQGATAGVPFSGLGPWQEQAKPLTGPQAWFSTRKMSRLSPGQPAP